MRAWKSPVTTGTRRDLTREEDRRLLVLGGDRGHCVGTPGIHIEELYRTVPPCSLVQVPAANHRQN